MLEIFVDEISERLKYTFDFVFLANGIPYKLNNDYKTFEASHLKKFNYSERYIDHVYQLIPSTLLFEESIKLHSIEKSIYGEEECLSFDKITDPFASIFYVISRMEEYGNILHDDHERFPAKQSIQYKFGWLNKLVCERWSREILHQFRKINLIDHEYQLKPLNIIPSFDIDNAYAYQLKEGSRKWFSIIKDYTKRDKFRLDERKRVLGGQTKDPYDTYDKIENITKKGFKVHLFWLLGDFTQFDRNISHKNPKLKRLIRNLNHHCVTGIHPSYKSNTKDGQLELEIGRLKAILSKPVVHSRQHFLKFRLPTTYRNLIEAGIAHDYSMGYASEVGFRAGTIRPFYWFDVEKNIPTKLLIHPFAYMDGTLNEYLKLTPESAQQIIQELYEEASQFGGDFFCLWHNETIGNYKHWNGWSKVLDYTLNLKNNE